MWYAEDNGVEREVGTLAEFDAEGDVTSQYAEEYAPIKTVWEQARVLGYGTPYLK